MSDKHVLIQKRLRDEGEKLLAVFESLTPEQWQTVIYTDGMTWTIKDLLAHQISAEGEFQFYGRNVLSGGEGAPEGFDINAFNNREVAARANRTTGQLLADFRSTRQATIDFVAAVRDDQFTLQGRHPFFGMMTIEDLFKLIYRHNMMHARDIRKALGVDRVATRSEETRMELHERKHLIHDHLIRTREELLEVIGQMQPVDWERPVQAEGGWTVRQVMLHLATSENGQINAGKAIAAGQPTVPDDFDLNRYNRRQLEKNRDKQPPEILSGMAESRQKLLAFLDEVSAEELDKRGKHGRGDVISLEQLFYRIGEHEAEHTLEIKEALT